MVLLTNRPSVGISRVLFSSFFLLMILEGAIRKWVAPDLGTPLQITRDLLPLLALFLFLVSRPPLALAVRALPIQAVVIALAIYILIASLSVFLSGQQSMGIPLLGLRTHFAYFPLAFLVPACFNCDGINRFFKALMLLALPVCTLAIYQSTQPATSWINIYGTGDAPNAMFGDDRLVRATGTFSYITGMGYFAQFAAATSFYLAMIANDGRRVGLAYLTFALALMACFATGSRAAIFGVVFQIILMILFSPPLRRRFVQRSLSNLVWVAIGCVGIYMAGALQLDAFLERTGEVSGDVGWRVSDLLTEWASVLAESPLGSGVGSGHQQAATFLGGEGGFGGYDSLPESELSRVAWELGILGFLAFGIFRIVSLLYGAMVVKQESKGANSILASFALSTMVPLVTSGIYSPMANALFWLSLGLFRLVRIQARPP